MKNPNKISLLELALFVIITCLCLGIILTRLNMPLEGGAIAVFGFSLLYLYLDRKYTPGLLIGPSIFLFFIHVLGYAIGPLAQRYILHSEHFIEKGMVMAQWGAVLGLATYAFIYPKVFRAVLHRFSKGDPTRQNASPAGSRWAGYTILLVMVSVSILLYGHFSGGMRRIGVLTPANSLTCTILYSFLYVQYVVFFFLGFLAAKRRGWWIILAIFMYVAYAGFQTLEGNRGQLISSLLMLANGVVWGGFSVRKTLLILGLSAFILIPLAGIVDFYRSTTTGSQYEKGFLGRMSTFSQAARNLKTAQAEGVEVASRAFIYAISAITVDRVMIMTPSIIPHAGFEKLDALFYIYAPIVIAPNRPEISDGNSIAALYGIGTGRGSITHYYIPSVGEGYRRFGWVGIPIIYALSGIIFGVGVAICWAKRQRREWAAMLAFLVLQAPAAWGFTLNYLFYFALFYLPKYYIYFAVLSKLQDVSVSFCNVIRRPGLVQQGSGGALHQD